LLCSPLRGSNISLSSLFMFFQVYMANLNPLLTAKTLWEILDATLVVRPLDRPSMPPQLCLPFPPPKIIQLLDRTFEDLVVFEDGPLPFLCFIPGPPIVSKGQTSHTTVAAIFFHVGTVRIVWVLMKSSFPPTHPLLLVSALSKV